MRFNACGLCLKLFLQRGNLLAGGINILLLLASDGFTFAEVKAELCNVTIQVTQLCLQVALDFFGCGKPLI